MSGRGQGRLYHRGHIRGGRLPSSFKDKPSHFRERRRLGGRVANLIPLPPPDEVVNSNDGLIHEIKNYAEGVEGDS